VALPRLKWALILCALTGANTARAGETYYVMVFGAQRAPTEPHYTHSWAVFVKATDAAGCPGAKVLEHHTISWMPQTLVIRVRALLPEPGVNLDIPTTFRWVLETGQRVSMWGPYQIEPELYGLALKHRAVLESGQVCYKAVDVGHFSDRVSNCIHAVSSAYTGPRLRVAVPGWGETASFLITRRMKRWFINPHQRHEWVATALGLDQYPIIRRELENPRTGVIWDALRTATGHGDSLGRGVIPPGSPVAPCPPGHGP
jgi:hypothetical protein